MAKFVNTLSFARGLDRQDPLRAFRKEFFIPRSKEKIPQLYFTGNSLGLQPVVAGKYINEELEAWKHLGVDGHFHGPRPWLRYHQESKKVLAQLTGARVDEVVSMNQLTINLHLMLASFYRPSGKRKKVLMEAGAFSSDQYAVASQIVWHGLKPEQTIIEISPRAGEYHLRTEDILSAIETHNDELSLVLMGAVQYYSGQLFDLRAITTAAHRVGARAGFDLAHAIGNVPLHLHDDGPDFAVWCSYKYLNSGPGSIAGAFVHHRHAQDEKLTRLAGWWGHQEEDRFQMKKEFRAAPGIDGWQVSNFPVLAGAAQLASLALFRKAGIQRLVRKSRLLTGYLYWLLKQLPADDFKIITPENPNERGCQVSILMKRNGKKVFGALSKRGVIADWREPNAIRVAPVPLYNTFEEVFRFVKIFEESLAG